MSATVHLDAMVALDRAIERRGEREITAQCSYCGFPGAWPMFLARETEEADGGYFTYELFQRDRWGEEAAVTECDSCGGDLAPDLVDVLDDRRSERDEPYAVTYRG